MEYRLNRFVRPVTFKQLGLERQQFTATHWVGLTRISI